MSKQEANEAAQDSPSSTVEETGTSASLGSSCGTDSRLPIPKGYMSETIDGNEASEAADKASEEVKVADSEEQLQIPLTTGVRQTQLLMERCRQIQELCGSQNQEADDLIYWKQATESFYEPDAKIRTRLWCPDTGQTRSYLLSYEFIPRYLRASFKDTQMKTNLFLGDVDETNYPSGEIIMDAKKLTVIHQVFDQQKYVVKGQLKIHFSPRLKIIFSDFSITYCLERKTPDLNEPQASPPPLINEYGVTHELMRYMEMAEIFSTLGDIMSITKLMNISPSDGLSRMANAIESHQMMSLGQASSTTPRVGPQQIPNATAEPQTPNDETPHTTPNDAGYYQDVGAVSVSDSKRASDTIKADDLPGSKKTRT